MLPKIPSFSIISESMAIRDDLIEIGLSEKQVDAYLALLELGPSSIADLARKSGLKRTTVYEILGMLISSGLATTTIFGKRKRFIAESSEKFFQIKKAELDKLRDIIPTLEALRNVAIEKPALQFFQGHEALRHVLEDMCLNTDPVKDKLLAIETKADIMVTQIGEQFLSNLIRKMQKRRLESFTIDTFSKGELENFVKKYPWSVASRDIELRVLEDPDGIFSTSIYLYQNKVALVAVDQLIALVIENARLKKSFEFVFYKLWGLAEPWDFYK